MKDKRTLIASRIRAMGLTQKAVAEKIGYDNANFTHFLKGDRSIPFRILERLESFLGI